MMNPDLQAVLMVCPFCSRDIQELWQPFIAITDWQGAPHRTDKGEYERKVSTITRPAHRIVGHIEVRVYWAVCPKCRELLVQIRKSIVHSGSRSTSAENLAKRPSEDTDWLALPQRKPVPLVDELVPDGMARDFREACLILEDSPRMSSVLSRKILADLLEENAHIKGYTLATQINKFIDDTSHPLRHRKNLHYLREIGDFSAHTKKDSRGEIIDVTPEEAEWTIKVVAELFLYFIVEPAKDQAIRSRIDQKLQDAGRKPIKQLGVSSEKQEEPETPKDKKGSGDSNPKA